MSRVKDLTPLLLFKSSACYAIRSVPGSILLALTLCVCAMSPQVHAFPVSPPRVRLTGALVPPDHQNGKGLLENLNVIIESERSILLLDKMETVGDVGINRVILQRLFPPVMHISGPDDLIRRLKSVESAKVLTLEGLLYTGSRTLFLIRVDESDEPRT